MSDGWWALRRASRARPPEAEPVSGEARRRALLCEHEATKLWPDPYGPDTVVFGAVPRVRGER